MKRAFLEPEMEGKIIKLRGEEKDEKSIFRAGDGSC